jgi:hypothetical protein
LVAVEPGQQVQPLRVQTETTLYFQLLPQRVVAVEVVVVTPLFTVEHQEVPVVVAVGQVLVEQVLREIMAERDMKMETVILAAVVVAAVLGVLLLLLLLPVMEEQEPHLLYQVHL